MKKAEIIERVASGLRRMEEKPDAFLFSTSENFTWDEAEILGIPVFFVDVWIEFEVYNNSIGEQCYFLPIWITERSSKQYLSKLFFEGWDDYGINNQTNRFE